MYRFHKLFLLIIVLIPFSCFYAHGKGKTYMKSWKKGYLDIHQISTGRGNAAFMILPDGTKMLFDIGNIGDTTVYKMNMMPAVPSSKKAPEEWVAAYIEHFTSESGLNSDIDYAVISHFDEDHMGMTIMDDNGNYASSGIVALDNLLKINKIIDRGLDYPTKEQLYASRGFILEGYEAFMKSRADRGFKDELFKVGANEQIVLLNEPEKYSDFEIRNIYSNGLLWTGNGYEFKDLVPGTGEEKLLNYKQMHENKNSCVINISYGDFDYHTGGDIHAVSKNSPYQWNNIEKAVGDQIGETDVIVANHHACSDATSFDFIDSTDPQVCIVPIWDYYHIQPQQLKDMLYGGDDFEDNEVYTAGFVPASIHESYPELYSKLKPSGHVVLRVYDGGKYFRIFVLNDRSTDYEIIYSSDRFRSR